MAGPEKVRYTHEAMADAIIANPAVSQDTLASLFGYTPGWVSQVINSDGFQTYLEKRKEEIVNPVLRLTIEERLKALVVRSTEVLQDALAVAPSAQLALDALNVSVRALGYGAKGANINVENAQFVVALPSKAKSSEEWAARVSPERIIDAA